MSDAPPDLPPVDDTPPHEPDSAGPKPAPVFADAHAKALHRVETALAKGRWPIEIADGADPAVALAFYVDNDGLGENPPGSNANWITDRFGLGHVPWCAETVSFALNLAFGGNLDEWQVPGVVPTYPNGIAYVPYMRAAFDAAGLYERDRTSAGQPANLRPGDVAILFGEGHTGLIEAALPDGTYLTREGNYGDRIGQFHRSRAVLDGVCHPPYAAAHPPKPDPPKEDEMFSRSPSYPCDLLTSAENRKVLDIQGNPANGAGVGTWVADGQLDQRWRLVGQPPLDETCIVSRAGDFALDSPGGSSVHVWEWNAANANQRWIVRWQDSGMCVIEHAHRDGMVLTLDPASNAEPTGLTLAPLRAGDRAQLWLLTDTV